MKGSERMKNWNYNALALEIFGEMAFEDTQDALADAEQFATVAEELLNDMEPAWQAALVSACLEGKEITQGEKQALAMALRRLRHPGQSGQLKPFVKIRKD